MSDQIITLPRDMPEWARDEERRIKCAMADLQQKYNLDAEPLVHALSRLYDTFPERVMVARSGTSYSQPSSQVGNAGKK